MVMAFVFSASAADLEAGSFSVGVRAGVGLTNVTGDYEGDNTFGFHVGAVGDYFFTDGFYGEAGLLLSKKGAKDKALDKALDLWYLELPILAGYRFNVSDDLAINAQVGPYLGYGLFGDFSYEVMGHDVDVFKKFDFGAKFQAGVFVSNFSANIGYGLGLANISENSDVKAHNSLIYLTLGYNF